MADKYEDPFRLRVMMAMTTLLEGITEANQYKHTMTGKVWRGRNFFGDSDPLPMLSILEVPIQPEQGASPEEAPKAKGFWDITIQGFLPDDKHNPTDPAYRLAADVCKCLAAEKKRSGLSRQATGRATPFLGITAPNGTPAISDLVIGSPTCRPPDEVSGKAYFWLTISLKIAENLEDPYN